MLKTMTVRTTIAAFLAGLSMSAHAIADTQRIDIPAGSLLTALETLAKQANVDLVYQDAQIKGLRTGGVAGELSPHDAVVKLLQGTPLKVRRDEASGAILITIPPASAPAASSLSPTPFPQSGEGQGEQPKSFWSRLRLAQSDTPSTSQVNAQKPSPSKGEGQGEDEKEAQSQKRIEVEEIVVVGSRLGRTDEGQAPVTVFARKKIESLGVNNVADVLTYLPQQSFSLDERMNTGGSRPVQLRGLSAGTTLVLINGRRTVPGSVATARGFFDLNTIPLTAVERIEVLSDSASAVYGTDAVGGVVNVVLKSNIERPVLDLYYGTAEGGAEERRVSLGVGGDTGRARGGVVVDYFRRDPLFGRERSRFGDADYRRFGGRDRRETTAAPGNVCASGTGNLPGLPTPCAAVPAGSTGVGLTPAGFLATAAQQNRITLNADRTIVPAAERYSAMAFGELDLTDQASAFAEFLYADLSNRTFSGWNGLSRRLVPTGNPFNPFGVPVLIDYLLIGLPEISGDTQEKSYRYVAGVEGNLGHWDWEASVVHAASHGDQRTVGFVNTARVNAALASTNPATALNVFGSGPAGSPALLGSLLADPSLFASAYKADSLQVGGFVRGALFQLPAGQVPVVIGAEWREEAFGFRGSGVVIEKGDARRKSKSAYAEVRIPLLGGDWRPASIGDLDVTVAGRYDHYSDFGGVTNMQYGLEWRPVRTLLARASYGESFRAPGLWELYLPKVVTGPAQAADPRRGNEVATFSIEGGGNRGLESEISTSYTFGLVWTPDVEWRPRLAVSAWHIEQKRRIQSTVPAGTILANEEFFPERVIRNPPTPADIAAGRPGTVMRVVTSLVNSGFLKTSGLDFEASAAIDTPWGQVSPSISATRVETYKAAAFVITPVTERVGVANTAGSVPRWRVVGSLAWRGDALQVTTTARYTSAYDDVTSNVRNGLRVDSQVTVDLSANVALDQLVRTGVGVEDGLSLRLGVRNVFDKSPPFSDVGIVGYDPSQGDLRGRFAYVAISKVF